MPGKQSILSVERYRPDGLIGAVVVDPDAPLVRKMQRNSQQYLAI
jgi:hypothetical protein